jgi:hypothetical protein
VRRLALIGLVALSGTVLWSPAEATPTRVRECIVTGAMTFSPSLTPAHVTSGDISYTYTAICAVEYTNGATGTQSYTTTIQLDYQGSCLTAAVTDSLNPASVGLLVGGTTLSRGGLDVSTSGGSAWAGTYTLTSSNPCDMSTASVVSATDDVILGTAP